MPAAGVRGLTRRDRRRAEIVSAARRIVAERGLEGLTFAALEQRLEFTRGVATYHFRDKDELVREVLESALREIAAGTSLAVRSHASPENKLRALLKAQTLGFIERVEAGRVLLSFWGRLGSDPDFRRRNARLYAAYRRQTERLLREGMRAGAFRSAPASPLAALIVGTVLGLAAQHHFQPGSIDAEAAVEEASRALLARLRP
jgi:AcrR family transcriptional regulator